MWNFNSWNVELELSSLSNPSIKTRDINLKEANFSNGALKVYTYIYINILILHLYEY